MGLPGPFWASFNLGGRRRGRGRASGPGGCLSLLLILFLLPFYLLYLVVKLYQLAWNKPSTRRGKILSVSGVSAGLLVLIIIGAATGSSNTPAPKTPTAVVATSTPSVAPTTPKPTVTHTAKPKPTVTHTAKAKPTATHTAKATYAPTPTYSAPAPVETHTAPAEVPTTQAPAAPSCYPLTNGGNCYEPGEFCRNSDHGATGVAGDGKSIQCEDNNGWRWEPA